MKAKKIKKEMLERFKKKLPTFKLVYREEDETTSIYILNDMLLGTIAHDTIEQVKMVGYELKRLTHEDIAFEPVGRFTGKAYNLVFDIMLGVCCYINDGLIDSRVSTFYLYDPLAFFEMTYCRDEIIAETV